MAQSDMIVFNEYLMPMLAEIFPQKIAMFNSASNNTMQLQSANFDGNYLQESFYQALHTAQRRVDRNAAIGAQAATDLTQAQHNTVKVAGGFGPILFEPSQMTWLRKPTQEGLTVAAGQFAEALLADQLNTLIASLVAAIGNVAAVTTDVSGVSAISQSTINTGIAKFGDASQDIRSLVMTGLQYHNLIGEAITNTNSLFTIGGVAVMDGTAFGQGRPIVITDAPALTFFSVQQNQNILGLTVGAGTVKDGGDIVTNIETTNGKTRIETTMQTDYSFGVGLKGYSWDIANGGSSPSDAALATGTNWDKVVASDKHTAGVIIIGRDV